jgi:hypothetical protein
LLRIELRVGEQSPEAPRETAPFLLVEEIANFASTAVRLDRELARMQGRFGGANLNLCPVALEHDAVASFAIDFLDLDGFVSDGDRLTMMAALHGVM